ERAVDWTRQPSPITVRRWSAWPWCLEQQGRGAPIQYPTQPERLVMMITANPFDVPKTADLMRTIRDALVTFFDGMRDTLTQEDPDIAYHFIKLGSVATEVGALMAKKDFVSELRKEWSPEEEQSRLASALDLTVEYGGKAIG